MRNIKATVKDGEMVIRIKLDPALGTPSKSNKSSVIASSEGRTSVEGGLPGGKLNLTYDIPRA